MKRVGYFLAVVPILFAAGCVPPPATIPSPQSTVSLPSPIPTPSTGMPSPPSIPGMPSPDSGTSSSSSSDSSSSSSTPSSSTAGSNGSGPPSPSAEGSSAPAGSEKGAEDGAKDGNPSADGEDSDSIDVSLEDANTEEKTDPTFEEPAASASSSSDAPVLDRATIEELERVLEQELGTFDSTIQREQKNAEQQSQHPSAGSAPVVVFEDYPGPAGSKSGSGGGSGTGSAGGGSSEGNVTISVEDAQIPPANPDDDIVARQLREAAIAETDPVLKERLWEEYYRYTGAQ